jgi:SAM-dependent methyltransferase
VNNSNANEYLLGSRDEELRRLAFQHRMWAEHAFAHWKRAGFGHGARLVDLGCGPGLTTVDLALLVGAEGQVIAVDNSEKFLAHLRSRVTRALRPGAALAVSDYFNYRAFTFAPRSAILDRIVVAVEECWRRRGGDLEIQGRMPGIMRECGLEVTEVSQVCPVAEPGSDLWNWPRTFFEIFMDTLVGAGLTTPEDRLAFAREWDERGRDPSSRLYLPPQIEIIGNKPA